MSSYEVRSAPSDISFTQAPMPSPYTQHKSALPSRGHPRNHQQQRKRDMQHGRKRTKVDTDSALESLDYWIQFDDDEAEKAGSFEIDFSKRYDMMNTSRPNFGSSATPGLGTGIYATAPTFKGTDFFDDNALDNALSDDEEGLDSMSLEEHLSKIETMPPPEVPPREGLYSTPLSWEKPEPGLRVEPNFGMGDGSAGMNPGFGQTMPGVGNQVLSNDEQRRLLAIAMNTSRTPATARTPASFMPPSGFGLGFGAGLGTGLPPDFSASIDSILGGPSTADHSQRQTPTPTDSTKAASRNQDVKTETSSEAGTALSSSRPGLSRTTTTTTDKGKDKLKAGDRTAHNDIERKYRTNLKDKISELRDAVPALHSIPEDGVDEGDGSDQRAPKVSKGTVLTKATEYIQYLERRNRVIMKEHQELARRLQAFEQLLSASARQPFLMPNHSRTIFDPRGFC